MTARERLTDLGYQTKHAVLSPDGSLLAFVARPRGQAPQLYVRRIAELEAVELAGTEGARDPFFSPDGQWVGFLASGKLKKVPVAGGTVITLCEASNTRGAWWSEDGRIVFNHQDLLGGIHEACQMRPDSL